MESNSRPERDFELLRLSALGLILLVYRAWNEFVDIGSGSGSLIAGYGFSPKWLFALIAAGTGFLAVAFMSTWALLRPRTLLKRYARIVVGGLTPWGKWRYPLAAVVTCLPSVALLGDWGKFLVTPSFRFALMLLAGLVAGLVISFHHDQAVGRIGLMILVTAAAFAAAKLLVQVTDYPFKLYWSEGNRIWDYSLYFARDRYQFAGEFQFPSYLTPGRHGLWGLPFLIPGIGIAALRLWDALLWLVPAALLGWALTARQNGVVNKWMQAAGALWALLFLTQIGVYPPLILSISIAILGIDPNRPVKSGLVAAVAGLYAGLSRWTWIVAPAIVAGLWILLQTTTLTDRRARWMRAVVVGLSGLAGGLLSQGIMAIAFPRTDPIYSTSLNQPLLWNRLFPNATSEQGILFGALIACGPLLGILVWSARNLRPRWGWPEAAAATFCLVVLLAVGLVASVKIGGGSNLHNLDMFVISLMAVVGLALMQLIRQRSLTWSATPIGLQALIVLAVMVPSFDAMRTGGPLQLPGPEHVAAALDDIRDQVEAASLEGEVLFIDQRQLLTFGQIQNVPLTMDYELKDLMNQAMGSNTDYLERFWNDLAEHRFALILSDPLPGFEQGTEYEFGEENDAWLRYVAGPLQESYEVVLNIRNAGVRLLAPRTTSP